MFNHYAFEQKGRSVDDHTHVRHKGDDMGSFEKNESTTILILIKFLTKLKQLHKMS